MPDEQIDVITPRPPHRPRLRDLASTACDDELFRLFITNTVDHPPTAKNYHAQLIRLAWFSRRMQLTTVRDLQMEDWQEFQRYLANPPRDHIMSASLARTHPNWRPFRGGLRPSSIVQACVVVKSFTKWMAAHRIIDEDPFSTKRNKSIRIGASARDVSRRLLYIDWLIIQQAIDAMPTRNLEQLQAQARARWIMTLAVLSGLRASEMTNAKAQDLKCIDGHWILETVRKGRVLSRIPITETVLRAYHSYCHLCRLATTGEAPLIASMRGKKAQPIDRKRLWSILKCIFHAAADIARKQGVPDSATRLQDASTHWLRHTYANWLTDIGTDMRTTRDLLDHSDIATTNQYLHSETNAMRQAVERLDGLFNNGFETGKPR